MTASRVVPVLLAASSAAALLAGCATILGIDHEYQAEDGGGSAANGGDGGAGGGVASSGPGGASGTGGDLGDTVILGVQTASLDLPTGTSLQKATITPVDPARSFLVFGARFDSTSPSSSAVSGQITGASELTFTRVGSSNTPAIPLRYHVAEFQSGVLVQRGTTAMFTSTVVLPLPTAVDLTRSFPLVSFRNVGSIYDLGDFVRAKVTAASELTLELGEAAPSGVVEWQVVTFNDATVQSGDVAFTASDAALTAPLPTPVDPAKTWLLFSYKVDSGTYTSAETLLRGFIETPTQLAFQRAGTGAAGVLTWYAVSFDQGMSVQSGTHSFGTNVSAGTAPLMPVDPTRSIAIADGIFQRCGTTTYTMDSNPGYATYTLDIGAGSELSLTRGAALSAGSDAGWSVIEFFTPP